MSWTFAKPTIVLISGKAGVGKTTAADFMFDRLKGQSLIYRGSFAWGLKDIANKMGWDGKKDERGRVLLQKLGSIGREYDINIWVRKMLDSIYKRTAGLPPNVIIIDDWRFPNERDFFKDNESHNVVTIRIESKEREVLKGTDQYFDPSENSLPPAKDSRVDYDWIIMNQGISLDEFRELVNMVTDAIVQSQKDDVKKIIGD